MSLVFSVEDVTIDINVKEDGDEELTDAASADDAQELEEADDEVEAIIRKGAQIDAVLNNLNMAYEHIRIFGVSKPALHLLNRGGRLSALIGQSLPKMESDDLPEDVDFDEADVDVEMALESIKEKMVTIKDAIKAFFKRLYDAVAAFFSKYFGVLSRLRKRLEAHKKTTVKNVNKADIKFGEIKVNTWSRTDFITLLDAATAAVSELNDPKVMGVVDDPKEAIGLLKCSAFLSKMGLVPSVEPETEGTGADSVTKYTWKLETDDANKVEKEEEEFSKIGFAAAKLATDMYDKAYKLVKDLEKQNQFLKKIEKANNDAIKVVDKDLKTNENADQIKAANHNITEFRKRATFGTQVAKEVCKKAASVVASYVSVLDKIKIKS